MQVPMNLLILKTVEEFGRIPLSYLYSRIPASPEEVKKQVIELAQQGAVRFEDDHVAALKARA